MDSNATGVSSSDCSAATCSAPSAARADASRRRSRSASAASCVFSGSAAPASSASEEEPEPTENTASGEASTAKTVSYGRRSRTAARRSAHRRYTKNTAEHSMICMEAISAFVVLVFTGSSRLVTASTAAHTNIASLSTKSTTSYIYDELRAFK